MYVDDGVEKLVGFTREELFGKSFLDFIDEPDRPLFNSILEHRNHFETNFDITALHIVTRDQQRIPANVVVSLNFIAGNPVNFQIIIDAGGPHETIQRVPAVRLDYRRYIAKLLAAIPDSYAADALDGLYEYLGDEQCLIYQVTENKVEPIHWRSSAPDIGIGAARTPDALLQWVAMSDEPYNFLDPDDARRAVEKSGFAPSEYIARLRLGGDNYLMRVSLGELTDTEEQCEAIEGVKQAIEITERLAPMVSAGGSDSQHEGSSVLNELKASLASAMRIASMLSKSKADVQ